MMKIFILVCILITLAGISLCGLLGLYFSTIQTQTTTEDNICSDCSIPIAGVVDFNKNNIYQVGDIVNVDGVHIVLLGWEKPGQIQILIFNRSEDEYPVFSQNQMYILDADSGVKYPSNPMLSILSSTDVNTMLRPGDWLHGEFAFINMILSDISGNYFIYDMDGLGNTLVKFEISPSPVTMKLPVGIAKALEGKHGYIGETFECGNLEILIDNPRVIGQEAILLPLPSNSYIVFDIDAKNTSDYMVTFNALDTFSLVDTNLLKYQQSFMAVGAVQGSVIELQELSPGESVSGQIGFEIPNKVGNVLLYVLEYGDAANRYFLSYQNN